MLAHNTRRSGRAEQDDQSLLISIYETGQRSASAHRHPCGVRGWQRRWSGW
jgi:hypothetical protein